MFGRILLSLACLIIGTVGILALTTMNVGLLVVTLLAIALVVRLVLHSRPDPQPTPAQIEAADEALERAREAFLREPSFKAVMPNHGAEQEL